MRNYLYRRFGIVAIVAAWPLLTASNCKLGGDWSKFVATMDTYTCACECDVHHSGAVSSYDSAEPIKATTCAGTEAAAQNNCPGSCVRVLQAQYDRLPKYTSDTSTVRSCAVRSAADVTLKQEKVCLGEQKSGLMAATPSDATFEGPVDFGRSYVDLTMSSTGDHARVPIRGTFALTGGNCPGASCDIAVWRAELSPKDGDFTTNKGHKVSDLVVLNEGPWDGTKHADNSFSFTAASKATLSGTFSGKHYTVPLDVQGYVKGAIHYTVTRSKASGTAVNNAVIVDASFAQGGISVQLHVHVWLTNCQPQVTASASCWGGPDGALRTLHLSSSYALLSHMKSQDLCNAMKASDYTTICTAGGTPEFPTFSCQESTASVPTAPAAAAQHLQFTWTDRYGNAIADSSHPLPSTYLQAMPAFPLTLTVENEWGRKVSDTIASAPTGACPDTQLWMGTSPWSTVTASQELRFVTPELPVGTYDIDLLGTGDADLYVRVGDAPTSTTYDCRPYSTGTDESCSVSLASPQPVHVMVRGYAPSSDYLLRARWHGLSVSGVVGNDVEHRYRTTLLDPGTYRFTLSGNGDADLYVRAGSAPTTSEFDCRPYTSASAEQCEVHLDSHDSLFVMVRGYAASSSYQLAGEVVSLVSNVDVVPDDDPLSTIDPGLLTGP